jgi:hypothetical protein
MVQRYHWCVAIESPLRLPVTVRNARTEDLTWFATFATVEHIEQCRTALGRSDVRLLVAVGPQDQPLGELFLRLKTSTEAVVDTVCVHGPMRGIGSELEDGAMSRKVWIMEKEVGSA